MLTHSYASHVHDVTDLVRMAALRAVVLSIFPSSTFNKFNHKSCEKTAVSLLLLFLMIPSLPTAHVMRLRLGSPLTFSTPGLTVTWFKQDFIQRLVS